MRLKLDLHILTTFERLGINKTGRAMQCNDMIYQYEYTLNLSYF